MEGVKRLEEEMNRREEESARGKTEIGRGVKSHTEREVGRAQKERQKGGERKESGERDGKCRP